MESKRSWDCRACMRVAREGPKWGGPGHGVRKGRPWVGAWGRAGYDLRPWGEGPQSRLMSGSPRALTRQLPGRAIGQERRTRSKDIVVAAMPGQPYRRTDEVTGRRRSTGPSIPSERAQHPLLAGGTLGLLDLVLGKQFQSGGKWFTHTPPSPDNGNF